jgi:hypothetical protein
MSCIRCPAPDDARGRGSGKGKGRGQYTPKTTTSDPITQDLAGIASRPRSHVVEDLITTKRSHAQQLDASTLHREEKHGRVDTGCDIAGCYIQFPTHVLVGGSDEGSSSALAANPHAASPHAASRGTDSVVWSGLVYLGWCCCSSDIIACAVMLVIAIIG